VRPTQTTFTAETLWERGRARPEDFIASRYSRAHRLRFDGGADVPGSSSPHSVPLPWSDASAVDPEEAFVSALSSCHMLFFLSLAAGSGFVVDRYEDAAIGTMEANGEGRIAMTVVTLRPAIAFFGAKQPSAEDIEQLHHAAHEACYIANSVRTEVRVEPAAVTPRATG